MKLTTIVFIIFFAGCNIALNAQIKTKQEKGFFNITNIPEFQFIRAIDSTQVTSGNVVLSKSFEINTINGMFLNPNFSIGLGLGVQFAGLKHVPAPGYSGAEGGLAELNIAPDLLLMPVFADFRYYFKNSLNGPMIIVDAGYALLLREGSPFSREHFNGGPLIKIGGGYKIHLGDFTSLVPSLNFKAQRFGDNTTLGATVGLGFIF